MNHRYLQYTAHKCDGCYRKYFLNEEWKKDTASKMEKYYLKELFNEGKWDWVCDFTRKKRRTFKNCPCHNCLIKIVCETTCEELEELKKTKGIGSE